MKRITDKAFGLVKNVKQVLESFPELEQYRPKIASLDEDALEKTIIGHDITDFGSEFRHTTTLDSGTRVTLYTNGDTVNDIAPHLEQYLSLMEEIHDNRELMEREPYLEAYLKFSITNIQRQLYERTDSLDWMNQ